MNGKQVLITGATNGIGLAAAKALAGLAADVTSLEQLEQAQRLELKRLTLMARIQAPASAPSSAPACERVTASRARS